MDVGKSIRQLLLTLIVAWLKMDEGEEKHGFKKY